MVLSDSSAPSLLSSVRTNFSLSPIWFSPTLVCLLNVQDGPENCVVWGRKLAVMSVDHSFDDDYTFHIPSPGGFRFVSTVASTDAADASHPN